MKTILTFILLSFAVLLGHAQPAAITASTRTINVNSNLVIVAPGTWSQIWESNRFSSFTFQMNTNTTALGVRTHLGIGAHATQTGTAGYFPYWGPGATNFAGTNLLYTTGVRIAMGTLLPDSQLTLSGNISPPLASGLTIINSNTTSSGYANIAMKSDSSALGQIFYTGSAFTSGVWTSNEFGLNTSGGGGLSLVAYNSTGIVKFATGGFAVSNERMRIDASGNILLNTTSAGTSLAKGLAQGPGTAPSSSPADVWQGWGADVAGAGDFGWNLRVEGGTVYKFGTNAVFLGRLGLGGTTPTAQLHLPAGTATASSAPLKFNPGTLMTAIEAGAVEYDGANFYGSPTSLYRRRFALADSAGFHSGREMYRLFCQPGTASISGYGDTIGVNASGSGQGVNGTRTLPDRFQLWETPAGTAQRRTDGASRWSWDLNPVMQVKIAMDSTASTRMWFGLMGTTVTASTALASAGIDAASAHLAGFRFDTGIPDTYWMAISKNGTTLTAVSTGVAPTTGLQTLGFECTPSSVIYYIGGLPVVTNVLTLPNPAATEGMYLQLGMVPLAGATTNGIYWTEFKGRQDY